jgi:CheY-like chemotaxis protein
MPLVKYSGKMTRQSLKTVLVVEDEILTRVDAVACLREAGFDVVEAASGAEALAVIGARDDVDLIFTDIQMPGAIDGLELARRARESHPQVRLVFTSGARRVDKDNLPGEGVFFSKPYNAKNVAETVHRLLS